MSNLHTMPQKNPNALTIPRCLLFLMLTTLASCGGCTTTPLSRWRSRADVTYTAAQVLPLAAGQQWTMQNQHGDFTYFRVLPRPHRQGCETGTFLDMHITKDVARAYWEPGIPGAWNHFILKFQDGSWRNVTNTAGAAPNPWLPAFETYQPTPIPDNPNKTSPYFLLPPNMSIRVGQKIALDSTFLALTHVGKDLTDCMQPADANNSPNQCCSGIVEWHTLTEVRQVQTPIYDGPAVSTAFCEGNPCIYPETWYFAPGIGLVEIDSQFPPAMKRENLFTKRIN